MMIDRILSTLTSAATSDFVYSSLSFFASRGNGELPGGWFVTALGALQVEEQAVRQTLFRLERTGVLIARRVGRQKWYRASPATEGVLSAGRDRVARRDEPEWDGRWTLVHFRVGEDEREARNRIRDVLLVEGFGSLGPGLYLHPRDRAARVVEAARGLGIADRLNVFRGAQVPGESPERLARNLWDLAAVASRYRKFLRRFEDIAARPASDWSHREAFGLRFAFMFEFFRITWDDPSLPAELLPAEWPGEEARVVADRLMRKLLPGAIAYGDEVLAGIILPTQNRPDKRTSVDSPPAS